MDEIFSTTELGKPDRRLISLALKAKERAYAPYSKYRVGCAIVDNRGRVHTGCNIETDSFLAAVCAERVAILKMISRGEKECIKVVVATSFEEPVFPCGVCRQVIREFSRDPLIIAVNKDGTAYRKAKLSGLFPFSYTVERPR
ncbi:MAG: cytidine deaminase [Deltaproteobacteria bacterium]|nr:cytidine deaminase [Deltaproteobacteria bacterium]